MSTPQKPPQRTCLTCHGTLPEGARQGQKYCSERCRTRAKLRRYRNRPEADPLRTAEEASALEADNYRLRQENARLRKLIGKIHTTRQRWQTRAATAEDRIAAERRRSYRKELAAAGRVRKANDRTAAREEELLEARETIDLLRLKLLTRDYDAEQKRGADAAARRMMQTLKTERQLNHRLRLHYPMLLGRYSRLKDQVFYDEFDQDFHTTLQLLRKQHPPRTRRTR